MSGSEREARELVQDVFVRAWEKLESFRGQSTLATWLHRLAKEPRRLLGRYLRYNSAFVRAFLAERLKRVWR